MTDNATTGLPVNQTRARVRHLLNVFRRRGAKIFLLLLVLIVMIGGWFYFSDDVSRVNGVNGVNGGGIGHHQSIDELIMPQLEAVPLNNENENALQEHEVPSVDGDYEIYNTDPIKYDVDDALTGVIDLPIDEEDVVQAPPLRGQAVINNPQIGVQSQRRLINPDLDTTTIVRQLNEGMKVGSLPSRSLRNNTAPLLGTRMHGSLGPRASKSALNSAFLAKYPNYDSSLRFPLDRAPHDIRPAQCKSIDYGLEGKNFTASVIFIFANEPFETLLRSVHSVLNTAPAHLLDEIILVDDGSDVDYISEKGSGLLESYIATLPKVRLLRTGGRTGIVQARLRGIREVKSDVFVILDSHIEPEPGWLEPLLYPIAKDPSTVTMPVIDGIDVKSFELRNGGIGCNLGLIWSVMEHSIEPIEDVSPAHRTIGTEPHHYTTSPAMAGGLFAAHKEWFLALGGYDEAMTGWGSENVEFSFRLWQCHGRLVCSDCSHVHHMFGGGKFYTTSGGSTSTNRMRTIAAWMDEYADLAWHVLGRPPVNEIGDLSNVHDLRRMHQCHGFDWFIENVYPETYVRDVASDIPYVGHFINWGQLMSDLTNTSSFNSIPEINNMLMNVNWSGPEQDHAFGFLTNALRSVDLKNIPSSHRGGTILNLAPIGRRVARYMYWKRPGYLTLETDDETCLNGRMGWNWCYRGDSEWSVDEVYTFTKDNQNGAALSNPFIDYVLKNARNSANIDYSDFGSQYSLVQLRHLDKGMCLTHSKGSLKFASCQPFKPTDLLSGPTDAHNQLFLVHNYEISDFWKRNAGQF